MNKKEEKKLTHDVIVDFKAKFIKKYPYISLDLTDQEIFDQLNKLVGMGDMDTIMDLFADYLLANGLCEVQE